MTLIVLGFSVFVIMMAIAVIVGKKIDEKEDEL